MRINLVPSRPVRTAVATVATGLALTACGGGNDPTIGAGGGAESGSSGKATPVPGIDAERNDADIAFITDMKPHHASAIDMAELAATRADSAQVKDLAARIVAAQDPEILTMEKMAKAWGVDLGAGGMQMGAGMAGDDVAALKPLSGAAFDKEFLTRMTAHHQSAVAMSEKELAEGENPQAKKLAQEIITAQNMEIAEMKTLLAAL